MELVALLTTAQALTFGQVFLISFWLSEIQKQAEVELHFFLCNCMTKSGQKAGMMMQKKKKKRLTKICLYTCNVSPHLL